MLIEIVEALLKKEFCSLLDKNPLDNNNVFDPKKYKKPVLNHKCIAHENLMHGVCREYEAKSFMTLKWFFDETGYEITEFIKTEDKLNIYFEAKRI